MLSLRDDGCPICESRNRTALGKPGRMNDIFRRFQQTDTVHVVRCSECTAMYVSPMIYFSDALQKELYNLQYFNADGGVQDLKNIGEKQRILRTLQRLMGGNLRGKSLLDVGSGTGEFLKTAHEFGMRPTGIDVEPTITQYIREKYGFDVVTGLLNSATFPPQSFDVVVLSHVIEHLQRPAELLAVIHSVLKNDGLFVMCTPNTDSLMEILHDLYGRVRRGRSKTYYLTPFMSPYHIVGFNLESSRRILQRAGFSTVYCKLHSGLAWADANRWLIMRTLKVAGALLGKGMSIVTISRKA